MEKMELLEKHPSINTSNIEVSPSKIIHRNIFVILRNSYPGVLLSYRFALEFKPTEYLPFFP